MQLRQSKSRFIIFPPRKHFKHYGNESKVLFRVPPFPFFFSLLEWNKNAARRIRL